MRRNLAEVQAQSFDQVRQEASDKWEARLSRIRIRFDATEREQRIFYSALGDCTGMANTCTVFLDKNRNVTASFVPAGTVGFSLGSLWSTVAADVPAGRHRLRWP